LIISVGRLAPNKRHDRLMEAFAHLAQSKPDVQLVLVGPNAGEKSKLKELAIELGIDQKVEFVGRTSPDQLQSYLAQASVWAAASEYESFGVALLEAMASGCIPVTSQLKAYEDFLDAPREGFFADFSDPLGASSIILEALSLPDQQRQEITRNARIKAARYTWDRIIGEIKTIYRSALTPLNDLLGVHVNDYSKSDILQFIQKNIQANQRAIIAHVNVHALNIAYELAWFRKFLNSCALVFCDGFGVKWGARLLGFRLVHRTTYADWLWELGNFSAQAGFSLFLLGSHPGIAEQAAARLQARFPDLHIVGTHHGYFNKDPHSKENKGVTNKINTAQPDILLVCFGMPLQENWLRENWTNIDATIALTGGAALDYISGELHRAPRWMTDHGLEWLGRMLIEPRRLWRRYLVGNPLFFWRVIKQRFGLIQLPAASNPPHGENNQHPSHQ
jgi:N-acetylglucosaminyldiphosphoundecaprenol N-acetyl-beta-D-mannosaminyltransferase